MSDRKPEFAPIWGLDVKDGELCIGGQPISLLAERAGATPFFAYGRDLLTRRVEELRTTLPERIHLHYAIKANPMPALVQHMAGLVDGLDVASGGELLVALDSGLEPETISFAGPGKTDAELTQAIASGIVINMESHGEMERIAEIAGRLGARPKVAIRVNPDFELKTSGMKMGGGSKQFGVDAEIVPQVLSRLGDLDLEFWGFHIFSGSQNLRTDALYEAQEKTFELAAGLVKHAPAPPKMLNIGGGLGIPYFPGDKHLDLAEIGDGLARLLPTLGAEFDDAEIVMELGRFLVGEAGIYVSRVVDKKESRGQIFLITDGGLHHQLAASGNFGQVLRKNYPVAVATRMDGEATESVDIVGCLCTPLDRLGDRMELPKAEVGDLVVLFQSGAYGLTASPTAFLGHPAPVEILV